jgi:hypothetical protein
MTLGQEQREFAYDVSELIKFIYDSGYECTLGDAFRDPRSHGEMSIKGVYGRAKSAHKQRLAIDLNLFKDGVYLRHTKAHAPIGAYWKGLNPQNRWGGDFRKKDGNHYSREYWGIS